MAQSSILGGEKAPAQASGKDADALGPSDTSDSGSDIQGERRGTAIEDGDAGGIPVNPRSDSDASGTGERGAAIGDDGEPGADIGIDRIEGGVTDALDDDPLSIDAGDVGELAVDDAEAEDETDDTAAR